MTELLSRFDPATFGPAVSAVLGDGRKLLPLVRGVPDERFRTLIEACGVPPSTEAGLWAYHDLWYEAHAVSQDLDTPEGSFWHAVLHRREPDAFNSNYWWRQVGRHPVLDQLRADAAEMGFADFTPGRFVAACGRGGELPLLQAVQLREWQLLFAWCVSSGQRTADRV